MYTSTLVSGVQHSDSSPYVHHGKCSYQRSPYKDIIFDYIPYVVLLIPITNLSYNWKFVPL